MGLGRRLVSVGAAGRGRGHRLGRLSGVLFRFVGPGCEAEGEALAPGGCPGWGTCRSVGGTALGSGRPQPPPATTVRKAGAGLPPNSLTLSSVLSAVLTQVTFPDVKIQTPLTSELLGALRNITRGNYIKSNF